MCMLHVPPLQVLIEPQLSAERTERKMRAALQEALERGLPEIVDTLLDHADDRTSAENTYSPRTQFDGEALARYPLPPLPPTHKYMRKHTHILATSYLTPHLASLARRLDIDALYTPPSSGKRDYSKP